jgi:hypothetical protein
MSLLTFHFRDCAHIIWDIYVQWASNMDDRGWLDSNGKCCYRHFTSVPDVEAKTVYKILEFYSAMIQLIAQEHFFVFSHYESFKPHVLMNRSFIYNDDNVRWIVNVSFSCNLCMSTDQLITDCTEFSKQRLYEVNWLNKSHFQLLPSSALIKNSH